jgi:hypothetical protein
MFNDKPYQNAVLSRGERNTMMNERYYLKADHQTEWQEVTQEQFVNAEQAAGFRPKDGCGPVATGGFTGRGMRGRVEYVTDDILKPAPNAGLGEWHEWEARESGLIVSVTRTGNLRFMARVEAHGPNGELNTDDRAVMKQIVADHNAVVKLRRLLAELIKRAEFALTTPGLIKGRDELRKAVDAAAAGVRR